ncbi:MAG: 3-methyl-2-oxobutanoate dehydrogenase subunit beta, partial [Desulfarculus sp.]|nr:3-methyl-2-oxobutanoate dehydrogenase subunit beta [Desulfarculus sp.]
VQNWKLFKKYQAMEREVRSESYLTEDAEMIVVAFGSVARILKTSVDKLRAKGRKIGLLRPITLFPFPKAAVLDAAKQCGHLMAVELNTGQMVEDVRLAADCQAKVDFYGRPPGSIPTPDELAHEIEKAWRKGGRQ